MDMKRNEPTGVGNETMKISSETGQVSSPSDEQHFLLNEEISWTNHEDEPDSGYESPEKPSDPPNISEPVPNVSRKAKSSMSAFKITEAAILQQTLPIVWTPMFHCRSIARIFLILSFFTSALSGYTFLLTLRTSEYRFNYTSTCIPTPSDSRSSFPILYMLCPFCSSSSKQALCSIPISIPYDLQTPVYFYYELTNIFQNHRSIIRSLDYSQLLGRYLTHDFSPILPHSDCGHLSSSSSGQIYFPCGLLPNLYFTDEFSLQNSKSDGIPLRSNSISWSHLKSYRFRNHPDVTPKTYTMRPYFQNSFTRPRDWSQSSWTQWWSQGGLENERFINWMTPSALSTFRKLYAIIDTVPGCTVGTLCKGNYTLQVHQNYPVDRYPDLDKAVIIGSTNVFGSPNYLLPILLGSVALAEFLSALSLLHLNYLVAQFTNTAIYSEDKRQDNEGLNVLFFHPVKESPSAVVFPDDWVDASSPQKTFRDS